MHFGRVFASVMALAAMGMLAAQDRGVRKPETTVGRAGPDGKFYAVLFAGNEYAEWPALQNPIFDATAIEQTLRDDYGFETTFVRNPTKSDFGAKLGALKDQAFGPNDELLIFVAGHGTFDEVENTGFLVARDSRRVDPLHDSYLSETQLLSVLSGIKCRHVLVVIDACFSGAIAMRGGDPKSDIKYPAGGKLDALLKKRDLRSLLFLTSGGKQYVPDGRPGYHSPFAFQFLRALKGGAGDPEGIVTFLDIVSFADQVQGAPQPRYGWFPGADPSSDFWLVAKPEVRKMVMRGDAPAVPTAPAAPQPAPDPAQVQASLMMTARDTLRGQGVGLDIASVKNALLSADTVVLHLLTNAGVRPAVFEEALRQPADSTPGTSVARRFFEAMITAPDAAAWFDEELSKGLNPNLTLPSTNYEREGVLLEAMRAASAPAMKALLKRGASPHAYQNLFLTHYPDTRFLDPIAFIADADQFTLPQKQELVKAFLEAGAVVPKPFQPPGDMGWPSVMMAAKTLQDQAAAKLGMPLPPTPAMCQQPVTPVCRNASARTGEDWCALAAAVPRRLDFNYQSTGSSPLYNVSLMHLINVDQNRMYFLGLQSDNIHIDYVLVEVSKDASSWTVLRFMEPEAGMGLCKKDAGGFQPQYCWRRIPIHKVAGTNEMRFDEWGASWKIGKETCPPTGK
jgi:hypothetical protein